MGSQLRFELGITIFDHVSTLLFRHKVGMCLHPHLLYAQNKKLLLLLQSWNKKKDSLIRAELACVTTEARMSSPLSPYLLHITT